MLNDIISDHTQAARTRDLTRARAQHRNTHRGTELYPDNARTYV